MPRRTNIYLIGILLLAAVFRVDQAWNRPVECIERDEYIPCAESISWSHLPIRDYQHSALPAYFIRLSSFVFSPLADANTLFAYRGLSVVAGLVTIVLIFLVARRWWGPVAGLVAALLLTLNNYHITVSARAIDLPYDLFFSMLTIWAFSNFLWREWDCRKGATCESNEPRPRRFESVKWLFITGFVCGLAFLCKEIAALLLPIFFLTVMIVPTLRQWLRRWELYVAAVMFFIVIAPDIFVNLSTPVDYDTPGYYRSYGDHLSKISGIGFSVSPTLFYFGDLFVYFDIPHVNEFQEIPFQNLIISLILWTAVLFALFTKGRDAETVFLLLMFFFIFSIFTFVETFSPERKYLGANPVNWYWVDRTLLAATLLAGRMVQRLLSRWQPEEKPT